MWPLTDRTFKVSLGGVARGRCLTGHRLQCLICHSARAWNAPGAKASLVSLEIAPIVLERMR